MKLPRKYFNEAEMIESFPEISLTLATEAKLPIFNSTTSSFVIIIILLHTGRLQGCRALCNVWRLAGKNYSLTIGKGEPIYRTVTFGCRPTFDYARIRKQERD